MRLQMITTTTIMMMLKMKSPSYSKMISKSLLFGFSGLQLPLTDTTSKSGTTILPTDLMVSSTFPKCSVSLSIVRFTMSSLTRNASLKITTSPFCCNNLAVGELFTSLPWRAFRDWYDEFEATGEEPLVITEKNHEEPDANTWAKSSSWKKYLLRYMYEHGLVMVYPNLPGNLVFATNHLMKGEHPTPNRKLFELPLVDFESARRAVWPNKKELIDQIEQEVASKNKKGKNKNKKYLSLYHSGGEHGSNSLNFELPELLHLKVFDVMFHEVEGGENEVMTEHKNLAGGGGGGKHHHNHGRR